MRWPGRSIGIRRCTRGSWESPIRPSMRREFRYTPQGGDGTRAEPEHGACHRARGVAHRRVVDRGVSPFRFRPLLADGAWRRRCRQRAGACHQDRGRTGPQQYLPGRPVTQPRRAVAGPYPAGTLGPGAAPGGRGYTDDTGRARAPRQSVPTVGRQAPFSPGIGSRLNRSLTASAFRPVTGPPRTGAAAAPRALGAPLGSRGGGRAHRYPAGQRH